MKRENLPVAVEARTWRISGTVQGVGFRPFVYRLAQRYALSGHVRNLRTEVEIFAEGSARALREFNSALATEAPPLARVEQVSATVSSPAGASGFRILPSEQHDHGSVHVPPDYFCCDACLRELADPADRRYRYPFINCTQCGPRFTLIAHLPYDRANTSMSGFAMCALCRAEYESPESRRFHAEPIACPSCGPKLVLRADGHDDVPGNEAALRATIERLRAGQIVAVKGIGGYHLMTDAKNEAAVRRLRARKHRPHKPLAVMYRRSDPTLALDIDLDANTARALEDPARPIVLARRASDCRLALSIAPGLAEIGVMTAYTPLHYLLLQDFGGPLIATSANMSGEPVLTDRDAVESRLAQVADAFLHHDRPIVRPADDPVLRMIAGKPRPIRIGRGCAPLELTLSNPLPQPTLAVGGHMKNTVALAWGTRAVVSPHIGDFGSPRTLAVFERTIEDLQRIYGVKAEAVVGDAHPGYASTRWAQSCGLPHVKVPHHHAHASALFGEYGDEPDWIVFTWDAVGLGPDSTLWGGEALVGRPGSWRRGATLRQFRLPGGEKAGREPWRSAAALCWEIGDAWSADPIARRAWEKNLNCPQTAAAGRLFDAAAAMIGLIEFATYEGQAAMLLEAAAGAVKADPIALPLTANADGILQCDWAPLIPILRDSRRSPGARAAVFHASLAHCALEQARRLRYECEIDTVGLAGGVFQNRLLTEEILRLLTMDGFNVRLARKVPCNDAGLAFGQLVDAGGRS